MREEARSLVKPGTPIIDICERVEREIERKGGELAFPCNVCVDHVAAHYSSPPMDDRRIPSESIVKVDLGVHVDGYIADTAATVSLNPEYDGMVLAVERALEEVIKAVHPKVKTTQLGRTAKETIERYGFKPVWNLTGHQMRKFVLHTGKSVPSVPKFALSRIKEGEVFAVEPFLTLSSGKGEVRGIDEAYIFRFKRSKRVKSVGAARLSDWLSRKFRHLPFSKRWLRKYPHPQEVEESFQELLSNRSVSDYPVLVERSGKAVAQAEHTLIVTEDGCTVTTL